MSVGYRSCLLRQGDTLERLAAEHLGDWSRWREIAQLNKLRSPFISDNPARWFGPEVSTGILAHPVGAGALSVPLDGERPELVGVGTLIFIEGYVLNASGNDVLVYDVLLVRAFSRQGQYALVESPAIYSWPTGTRYRLFLPRNDLDARVARPGERLFLPILSQQTPNVLTDSGAAAAIYGVDIALSSNGKLHFVDGDLLSVSGIANASQALWMRTSLPKGGYVIHPNEGNRCFDMIGSANSPEATVLAEGYVREALFTDPRVADVLTVTANTPAADVIALSATVLLETTREEVVINALVRGI